ncbi:ComEA family DNA-binding protein [Streptomyces sp. NPDC126503]|uniref:ComEA family DNA-binding protein n=1 Tax=Streptomyces sp. NPDC126503 TaxID=3155315 RepID=UPI0033242AC3
MSRPGEVPEGAPARDPLPIGGDAVRVRGAALFPEARLPEATGDPRTADREELTAGRSRPGRRERFTEAVRERVPLWVRTRCGLEPRTLAALAVVLAVAAVIAGAFFWTGRPEPVRAPEVVRAVPPPVAPSASEVSTPLPAEAGPPRAVASATGRANVVVDVSGKVRRPGVLTLPAGSRVADALKAAGGAKPGADLTALNRARVLLDGEQVLVGLPGAPAGGAGGPVPGSAGGPGSAGDPGPAAPLSLNAATAEQLDSLPGVGPVLARHIVDHRSRHGGFRTVAELRDVDGIGERRFADLEPLVRP